MRGGGGGVSGGIVGDPSPTLKASDVGRLNPVAMLLARSQAFAFTAAQVARLQAIRDSLDVKNAPHLVALDSVLAQVRRHATDTSGTEGDRLMRTGNDRGNFTAVLGLIRDNDDAAAQEAMEQFSGAQLRRVYNVIREQRTMMGAVVRGGGVPQFDAPNSSTETHT